MNKTIISGVIAIFLSLFSLNAFASEHKPKEEAEVSVTTEEEGASVETKDVKVVVDAKK